MVAFTNHYRWFPCSIKAWSNSETALFVGVIWESEDDLILKGTDTKAHYNLQKKYGQNAMCKRLLFLEDLKWSPGLTTMCICLLFLEDLKLSPELSTMCMRLLFPEDLQWSPGLTALVCVWFSWRTSCEVLDSQHWYAPAFPGRP